MKLCILHRIVDLYSGGTEVVMKNFIEAFPEWQHIVVFTDYYDTWLARSLEQMENVRLYSTKDRDLTAILAAEAPDVTLYHWYPSMKAKEIATAVASSPSQAVLYSHYFREAPVIDNMRYWFVAPAAKATMGQHLPDGICDVIINPVADEYFQINERPRELVIGRHSSARHLKFSPRFFELHEAISAPQARINVLGRSEWLQEEYEARGQSLSKSYTLLPLNSVPVPEFLGGLSIFVYRTDPRITETCPMVILEAMAAARPIITENRGGIVDLISDNWSGFLCAEEADFIQKIEWCIAEPDAATRMGEQAREWAYAHASMSSYRKNILNALASLQL